MNNGVSYSDNFKEVYKERAKTGFQCINGEIVSELRFCRGISKARPLTAKNKRSRQSSRSGSPSISPATTIISNSRSNSRQSRRSASPSISPATSGISSNSSSRVVSPFERLGGGLRYINQDDILNDLIGDNKGIDIMDFNLSPVSHI